MAIPYFRKDKTINALKIEYRDQINKFMPEDKKIMNPKDSDDSDSEEKVNS